jgi:hypothetical protein
MASSSSTSSDFPAVFAALKQILQKHSAGTVVQTDTPSEYTLLAPSVGPGGKQMWFGCVRAGKSAVSYHLMPLYFNPKLLSAVAPELLKRKGGKTCFNFQKCDESLFAQLDELTRMGREMWQRAGFFVAGPITQEKLAAALRASGENPEAIARKRKRVAAQAASKRRATVARKKTKTK